jgi:hypothetical protein
MVVLVVLVGAVPVLALRIAHAPLTLDGWSVRASLIGLCVLPATPIWASLPALGQLLCTSCGSMAAVGVLAHAGWLRMERSNFERHLASLSRPDASPATALAVQRYLLVTWPRSQQIPSRFAADVLAAAETLLSAGFDDAAESLFRSLPDRWLDGEQRAVRAIGLASCALRAGELGVAKDELRSAPACRNPAVQHSARILRAKLLAIDGLSDDALALVGERDGEPSLIADRAAVLTVRAHALASRGDLDGARAALSLLRSELGDEALDGLEVPSGPASSLARALRSGHEAAYR